MNLRELQELIYKATSLKASKIEEEENLLEEDAVKLAEDRGFSRETLEKVFGGGTKTVSKTRKPVEPKFRHPENPTLTWSGRGRAPKWYQEAKDAGQDMSKFDI